MFLAFKSDLKNKLKQQIIAARPISTASNSQRLGVQGQPLSSPLGRFGNWDFTLRLFKRCFASVDCCCFVIHTLLFLWSDVIDDWKRASFDPGGRSAGLLFVACLGRGFEFHTQMLSGAAFNCRAHRANNRRCRAPLPPVPLNPGTAAADTFLLSSLFFKSTFSSGKERTYAEHTLADTHYTADATWEQWAHWSSVKLCSQNWVNVSDTLYFNAYLTSCELLD